MDATKNLMNERIPIDILKHKRALIAQLKSCFPRIDVLLCRFFGPVLEYRRFVDGLITRKYSNLNYL